MKKGKRGEKSFRSSGVGEIQGPQPRRLASNQRILEYWNSLWDQWDTVVLDVGDEERIAGLLESWGRVAENLDNTKRSAASKLQSVIYRAVEDWDAVICEYKKLRVPE